MPKLYSIGIKYKHKENWFLRLIFEDHEKVDIYISNVVIEFIDNLSDCTKQT